MRAIDAEFLKQYKMTFDTAKISGEFIPAFVIDKAPTLDVVPVIRCKDCFHWRAGTTYVHGPLCENWNRSFCTLIQGHTDENFFCGYGYIRGYKNEETEQV